MVTSVTNLSRNGLSDWLIQRVTALLIGFYTVFIVGFLLSHSMGTSPITFQTWSHLFHNSFMRIATVLVVLSIAAHAWIGMWTVFTDYVNCFILRLCLQVGMVALLLGYVVWCIEILWS